MTDKIILPDNGSDDTSFQRRAAVLSAMTGVVTLLLALYGRSLAPVPTNVPIVSGDGRPYYVLALLASIGIGIVVEWSERPELVGRRDVVEPTYRGVRPPLPTGWILPSLTVLGVLLLVAHEPSLPVVLTAPILAGTGVFAATLVHHELFSDEGMAFTSARTAHLMLTYVIALLVLSVVALFKARTLYTAPVVFGVSFLLLVQVHDGLRAIPARVVVYAVVGGMILAEIAWSLSYWPGSGWYSGLLLATLVFVIGQITGAYLSRRLTNDVVLRYAGIAVASVLVIALIS